MTTHEIYEAHRQATSAVARKIPARIDESACHAIEDEIRRLGIGFTIEGYELAQNRLREAMPDLKGLQFKTLAASISKNAR